MRSSFPMYRLLSWDDQSPFSSATLLTLRRATLASNRLSVISRAGRTNVPAKERQSWQHRKLHGATTSARCHVCFADAVLPEADGHGQNSGGAAHACAV